jgi:hypothetical protein
MKFELCLPTRATTVPAAPEWFHEIKYDGYRLRLERPAFAKALTGGFRTCPIAFAQQSRRRYVVS